MTLSPEQNRRRNLYLAAGAFIVLLIAAVVIRIFTKSDVPVRAATASYQDLVTTISTNGKVEPIHPFEAHAPAPGVVEAISIHEGDSVHDGQELMHMDESAAEARVANAQSLVTGTGSSLSDLRQGGTRDERIAMEGDLQKAQIARDQAQKDLSALQQLQSKGAASASEVASAKGRLANAQSTYDATNGRYTSRYSKNDVARMQGQMSDAQAALASARKVLNSTVVKAPFDGTVYSLPVHQYDYINGGDVMLRLADLTQMQVRAYFDEPEIGKLAVGQKVRVTWDARPNSEWHGHVIHVPTSVTTYGTRSVGEIVIAIDDAHGDLLPNTNVNVTVTLQEHKHVLTIPREGLRTLGAENFVFVIKNGKLVKTSVELGGLNLTQVEIRGGLSEGNSIALNATTSVDLEPDMVVAVAH